MPRTAEVRFAAMGTECHVIVVGDDPDATKIARSRIVALEGLWSRFRAGSEISRINASPGTPVVVSRETRELVRRACEGRDSTRGLFDPGVLGSVVALGYDRTFDDLPDSMRLMEPLPVRVSSDIEVDEDAMTVTLAPGSGFDPGGIGKGYAADLVLEETMSRTGVLGVCVNVGGDLRVAGPGPDAQPWLVEIEHPFGGGPVGSIALEAGAIATSSRMRRRWVQDGRERHHLVDPRTGLPDGSGLASVTIVAGECWWAEVAAKAAFLAGPDEVQRVARDAGVDGVAVANDGSIIALGAESVLVA